MKLIERKELTGKKNEITTILGPAGIKAHTAVVVGLADLSPTLIVLVMAVGWLLVSLIEYSAWRQTAGLATVKRSVTAEYIVCLEDEKKFKSMKRHLRTQYNMTPEQYREKWNLPADYPMVAPNYAAARSQLAKQMGLGQQRVRRR